MYISREWQCIFYKIIRYSYYGKKKPTESWVFSCRSRPISRILSREIIYLFRKLLCGIKRVTVQQASTWMPVPGCTLAPYRDLGVSLPSPCGSGHRHCSHPEDCSCRALPGIVYPTSLLWASREGVRTFLHTHIIAYGDLLACCDIYIVLKAKSFVKCRK